MAVEYEISSDVATITGVASNTQVASIVKFYTGSITYDDEPTSKYASVTINGKTQRVMLCVAVSGTATYDDVPCLYSTVSGHRTLNVVAPTESGTPDDVPSLYETVVVDGKTVRALRCVLINQTPNYDGVSSTCTFTDNGKTHTAQLVNQVSSGSIETIVKGVSPLSLPDAVANSLSYVKAFGGTEQRNIPQPYTQVNYVTNTASTAVNTGIMIDFAKNYEFEVECRATTGSWYILQSRETTASNITGISGSLSGNTITLVIGNVTACQSAITRTVGNKLYVKATLNNGVATLYVKDETAGTEDTQTGSYGSAQPNPPTPVYLLGNAGGNYAQINSDIYMARIKENDTVVMDYVPARQVATAGFYDTVSGTFKTALTPANLSADGNTVPTPDTPMDIVSNNGVLKARHASGLPLGYTLLEYIESTGTQYIDTGVRVELGKVEIKYTMLPNDGDWATIIGKHGDNIIFRRKAATSDYTIYMYSDVPYTWLGGYVENQTRTLQVSRSGNNIIIYSNGQLVFEGQNNKKEGGVGDSSIYLFSSTLSGKSVYPSKSRLYYAKFYTKDGTLVRNLIPAKRNSDNVVGMYDTISQTFFTNAGTGDFTAGNPVSDPVEIYTDGTVETIEDTIGNTATAEMLLKVGDYQDVQSIIDGVVTRNVGVKVLDGTEAWAPNLYPQPNAYRISWAGATATLGTIRYSGLFCTHFEDGGSVSTAAPNKIFFANDLNINFPMTSDFDTRDKCVQYLAEQYAAGTPVIVIYPLATPTTESVAGQTLQVQAGDNTLTITQASLTGLELEAKFEKSA